MAEFEGLAVWRLAHETCLAVYGLAKRLPSEEKYGLTQQLKRAAYSVPANIAEGNERTGADDFAHFMDIALGSAAELRCLLILVRDLGFVTDADIAPIASRLAGLVRMLREFKAGGRQSRLASRNL